MWLGFETDKSHHYKYRMLSSIDAPSEMVAYVCTVNTYSTEYNYIVSSYYKDWENPPIVAHGNGKAAPAAFVDGHIEMVSTDQWNKDNTLAFRTGRNN